MNDHVDFDCSALADAFNQALGICMDPGKSRLNKLFALHDLRKAIDKAAKDIKRIPE